MTKLCAFDPRVDAVECRPDCEWPSWPCLRLWPKDEDDVSDEADRAKELDSERDDTRETGSSRWVLIDRVAAGRTTVSTYRMSVVDGWLVRVTYGSPMVMLMSYVPDKHHVWTV